MGTQWISIYNSEFDHAGRTANQVQSYGFHIHQAKFFRELLTLETIDEEKKQLRAVEVLSVGFSGKLAQTCQPRHHLAWHP